MINRVGGCPLQEKCWYSHSEEERSKHLIKKYCKNLRPDGTCNKKNCKFDHSIKSPEEEPQSLFTPEEGEVCKKICFAMDENGKCKYGVKCKFSHDMEAFLKIPKYITLCTKEILEKDDGTKCCALGKMCKYMHSQEEIDQALAAAQAAKEACEEGDDKLIVNLGDDEDEEEEVIEEIIEEVEEIEEEDCLL